MLSLIFAAVLGTAPDPAVLWAWSSTARPPLVETASVIPPAPPPAIPLSSFRDVSIAAIPVAKVCPCSPACSCGCNQGEPCRCMMLRAVMPTPPRESREPPLLRLMPPAPLLGPPPIPVFRPPPISFVPAMSAGTSRNC